MSRANNSNPLTTGSGAAVATAAAGAIATSAAAGGGNGVAPTLIDHKTAVVSYKAKLRSIQDIAKDLPLLFYAFNFRLVLLGLNPKELRYAATCWVNDPENREAMLDHLKALKRPSVTHRDLEDLSVEIFIGLRAMILDIKDEDIKLMLNGPIQEFCAQNKYRGCIARLMEYRDQAKEVFTKHDMRDPETLKRSTDAWRERINYVYTQRSWSEWLGDQYYKGPMILCAGALLYMNYLRFFGDPKNEAERKEIEYYSKQIKRNWDLIPQLLFMGSVGGYMLGGGQYMPHAAADAQLITDTLKTSFLRFIDRKAKENVQAPYLPFLELLPPPPPPRALTVVEEDHAVGPRKLKRYQQSSEGAAAAAAGAGAAAAAVKADDKDIIDAKSNNTYFFLSADHAKRYARFNQNDLKKLFPNKDQGAQRVAIEEVRTALKTDRNIPPPDDSEFKRGPFKNMNGKLRLNSKFFRLAFKARPATAAEKHMGVDGEVMSPSAFVKHQQYNRK